MIAQEVVDAMARVLVVCLTTEQREVLLDIIDEAPECLLDAIEEAAR